MPELPEKTQLVKTYQEKYRECSTNPQRADIRMQYASSSENPHNITQVATLTKTQKAGPSYK